MTRRSHHPDPLRRPIPRTCNRGGAGSRTSAPRPAPGRTRDAKPPSGPSDCSPRLSGPTMQPRSARPSRPALRAARPRHAAKQLRAVRARPDRRPGTGSPPSYRGETGQTHKSPLADLTTIRRKFRTISESLQDIRSSQGCHSSTHGPKVREEDVVDNLLQRIRSAHGGTFFIAMLCTAFIVLFASDAGAQCSARDVMQNHLTLKKAPSANMPPILVRSAVAVPVWKTIAVG